MSDRTHRHLRRPLASARVIVGHRRSQGSDMVLATFLSAIAGCANAGGFFVLGQYTSHMTGYLSAVADDFALADMALVAGALLAILSFVGGAALGTVLINFGRRVDRRRQYAYPIAVEGGLLLVFAACASVPGARGLALAVLCLTMGLQNATITKISGARIRTTHATGMITDVGIELGRALFRLANPGSGVRASPGHLGILGRLLGAFLIGGLVGALGYRAMGFLFTVPLALLLLGLALPLLVPRRG
ncbi:YoaK family protein [Paroceanicella profunda]|uniref:YoaK family protein n=1 Tax=Paroceanicella profunda TaxID=2579971 RepID=UPI00197EA4CA|nr:YoaK family protein [Paroceanicella profunda]